VKVVSDYNKGPNQVFADPAHALESVLDFQDLVGTSARELRDWQAKLGPDFRLSLVTCRKGTGPTLFNAVAVREKTPRLIRFLPESPPAIHPADLIRDHNDGFLPLHFCNYYPQPGQNAGWAQGQIWFKGDSDSQRKEIYHWVGNLDTIKNTLAEYKADNRRVRCLEFLPGIEGAPSLCIGGDQEKRNWEPQYSLSPEELLKAVEKYRSKGWRPDVLTPCWEDDELRFLLVGVNNAGGSDWRFRMDMTLDQYRKESAGQRERGWFPLALASYGNEAEVRYVAVWVRGRTPDTPLPKSVPPDARTLADRAVKAVSWTGAGEKGLFADEARALKDVLDFQEIVGVGSEELKSWQGKLDAKFRLSHLTGRKGPGPSLFNAIAVREKQLRPSRALVDLDPKTADVMWQRLTPAEGFRPLAVFGTLSADQQLPWIHHSVWVKDGQVPSTWHGSLKTIVDGLQHGRDIKYRPVYLAATMSPEGLACNTALGPDQGRAWDPFYSIPPEDLLSVVEFYKGKGWRPDVVAPYWNGKQYQYMLVVVDNSDKVDWRFRMDMTLAQYKDESAAQRKQGLFPLALTSYRNDAGVFYAAVFVRYRNP
jgi:hypothetical protein